MRSYLIFFKELIIHTSGDFDEAIDWLRELDKEYQLTDENYSIDDFINDLLSKGYISKQIQAGNEKTKISSKTERLLRKHVLKHLFGKLKKQKITKQSFLHQELMIILTLKGLNMVILLTEYC